MAAGPVTVSALRSRPRQAVLVAALSAVVTAAAALGPLYARAVQQSVLRHEIGTATPAQATLVVTDDSTPVAPPEQLAALLHPPPELATPVGGLDAPVQVAGAGARLTTRDDLCAHVHVATGHCPGGTNEVLVSSRSTRVLRTDVGRALTLTAAGRAVRVTVVGTYDGLDPSAPYWAGRATSTSDADGRRVVDDLLTTPSTLTVAACPELHSHLDLALRPRAVDLRRLDALTSELRDVDDEATAAGAFTTTGIPALLDGTRPERDEARSVVLLLTVQLAVLGLVVLAFVGAAVTEQRRPEIALARLRGLGARGAGSLVLREIGLLLLAGAAAGTVLALLVSELTTLRWLEPGVRLEVGRPVLLAVAGAFAAGLLSIAAAAVPTLRQPVTSLLRRVPPRASTLRVGLAEGAVAAAAAAGVITLLSGARGAVSLLAPGLLALAGGLLLSQLVVPVSARLAHRAFRRGQIPTGLALVQLARRPALRRLIAIVTVACALLVFAVDTWNVSARNRTMRAQVDAGAPVVLTVDATGPQALRSTVLAADPQGRFATPVVTARSATAAGPRALAVEPAAFARIARWGQPRNRPTAADLAPLSPATVEPVRLPPGTTQLTVTATFHARPLPRPRGFQGVPRAVSLIVAVADATGDQYIPLGRLRQGRATYRAAVPCASCTLTAFVIERMFGDAYPLDLSLRIDAVQAGTQPVDLGPDVPQAWQVLPSQDGPTTASVQPHLTVVDPSSFQSAEVRRGSVPVLTPALVAGEVPAAFRTSPEQTSDLAVAPDVSGSSHLYSVVHRLPLLPRAGARAVLSSLQTLGSTAGATNGQTTYEVWLGADDPGRERALRSQLAAKGLRVVARDSSSAHEQALAREGPTLALRLALLAGVLALLLAAAVLVVGIATSGAGRARDLAGLRVVGVPAGALRSACVREHLIVAVLGSVAGGALGLLAAQAALPDLPLSATSSALLPVQLGAAWLPVAGTVAACLVVLATVAVLVGSALAGSGAPDRLRDTT